MSEERKLHPLSYWEGFIAHIELNKTDNASSFVGCSQGDLERITRQVQAENKREEFLAKLDGINIPKRAI